MIFKNYFNENNVEKAKQYINKNGYFLITDKDGIDIFIDSVKGNYAFGIDKNNNDRTIDLRKKNFQIFEGTVSADVAQAAVSDKVQKRNSDEESPCKKDAMSEECQKKRLALKEATSHEWSAAEELIMAAEDRSNKIKVLGTLEDYGVLTRNAGYRVKINGRTFDVTVTEY